MKTICPHCQNEQDVPDLYREREVRCQSCKGPFLALEYVTPPDNPPAKPPTLPLNGTPFHGPVFVVLGIISTFISVLCILVAVGEEKSAILYAVAFLLSLILTALGFILAQLSRILEVLSRRQPPPQ